MKHILTAMIGILFLAASLFRAVGEENTERVDWPSLKVAFQIYADYPIDSNALKVIALLPKQSHVRYTGAKEEKETIDFIYDAYELGMLERQVISGNYQAVRLAFNLIAIADGGFAEDLDIMLGILIRINPKLFLEGLNEFHGLIGNIDGLVGNKGALYVDRLKGQCFEEKLRINALLKVREIKLENVREECIKVLQDQMREYCKDF